MVDKTFCPNTFDEYLNNTTGASSSQSYGAKFVPVKQWERDEFGSYCSCCGSYAYRDRFGQPIESKFCPNCGANLGGVTTDAKRRYIEVGKIPWRCAPNISPSEPFVTITDVKNMPDADVVKVVRCKDCVYARQVRNGVYHCSHDDRDHVSAFYCIYGEEKTDEK